MSERSTTGDHYRAEAGPVVSAATDAALEAFVVDNYPRLIRLAALVAREVDQAEDAVQAALERAWRSRVSINDPTRVRAWLDRIVVREAIRADRRRRWLRAWLRRSDAADEESTLAGRQTDPDELAGLRAAYATLSAAHRAVVALHLYAGYSVAETAALLEVPVDTVRSRLRAARAQLRRHLSEVGS